MDSSVKQWWVGTGSIMPFWIHLMKICECTLLSGKLNSLNTIPVLEKRGMTLFAWDWLTASMREKCSRGWEEVTCEIRLSSGEYWSYLCRGDLYTW